MNHEPKSQLVQQAKSKNYEALGKLLQKATPFLLNLAAEKLPPSIKSKTGDSDLVQDTCSAAVQGITNFRGETEKEFFGWLEAILSNLAITHSIRYHDTSKRDVSLEIPLESPSGNRKIEIISPEMSPSSVVSRLEHKELAAKLVDELPDTTREVVILYYRENQSFDEIAKKLGKSEAAVRKHWARAITHYQRMTKVPVINREDIAKDESAE